MQIEIEIGELGDGEAVLDLPITEVERITAVEPTETTSIGAEPVGRDRTVVRIAGRVPGSTAILNVQVA